MAYRVASVTSFLANLTSSGNVPSFRYMIIGASSWSFNCSLDSESLQLFSVISGSACNRPSMVFGIVQLEVQYRHLLPEGLGLPVAEKDNRHVNSFSQLGE